MTGIAAFLSIAVLLAAPAPWIVQDFSSSVETVQDLVRRGDFAAAGKAAESLVSATPQDGSAWYVLGVVRAELRDSSGAIEAYRKAVEFAPWNADAWNNLGDLLRRSGDLDSALEAIRRALAAAPKHPRASLNLALVSIELKDFETAVAAVDDAERGLGPIPLFDYLRARAYLEMSQPALAMPSIERFRSASPPSPGGVADLAKLLLDQGEYRASIELVLSLQPSLRRPDVEFMLAQSWYALDQMERARDSFKQLAEGNPQNAIYVTWLGHAERALGNNEEARSAFEAAKGLDQTLAGPLTELAHLELDAGRSAQALSLAEQALRLAPEDSRTQFVTGLVWSRMRSWEDAVDILTKVGPTELEYPQAQYLLSRAYRQLGNIAAADAALDEFRKTSSAAEMGVPTRRRVQ